MMSRITREMFCLMEGRHVHPSTLYPGGVGTVPTVQLFTDYLVRLMRYVEFMKKVVPLHDDLFDFFYEAMPGYEEVGLRRTAARLLGIVQRPRCLRLHLRTWNWGKAMFVTPGVVVDGKLVTTDLVDINLNIRILLGSSYYDDWENQETFVKTTRSAIPWTATIRGTRPRFRIRKSATLTANIRGSCPRAGSTSGPGDISRSIPAADRLPASGQPPSPVWSTLAMSKPPGTA